MLLDALEDFGGTLIFVSHDRYFVERLATKIVEVGHGGIEIYPGTYKEFLWHKAHGHEEVATDLGHFHDTRRIADRRPKIEERAPAPKGAEAHAEKKKSDAEERRRKREEDARQKRIADLEARIADREREVKTLEAKMAEPGFYDDADAAKTSITRHQQLMWEVGDLMNQWEALSAGD